jgi:hypothetical protein
VAKTIPLTRYQIRDTRYAFCALAPWWLKKYTQKAPLFANFCPKSSSFLLISYLFLLTFYSFLRIFFLPTSPKPCKSTPPPPFLLQKPTSPEKKPQKNPVSPQFPIISVLNFVNLQPLLLIRTKIATPAIKFLALAAEVGHNICGDG